MGFLLSSYSLSPKEAAAFWRLRLLDSVGAKAVAMNWLEGGASSLNVAALAGELDENFFYVSDLFEKVLADMGVAKRLSARDAVIISMRFLLHLIAEQKIGPFEGMREIINHFDHSDYKIFDEWDPRIKNPPRSKSNRYAGQDVGIEYLLGIYYSQDDYENITSTDIDKIKSGIVEESKEVLKRYDALSLEK